MIYLLVGIKNTMKGVYTMINKLKARKKALITSVGTWLALCYNTGVSFASTLGDSITPATNTVVDETNGLILPISIIGIIAIAVMIGFEKRTMAIVTTVSLIIAIILIKNANTIGAMISNGV